MCEELFNSMDVKKKPGVNFEVSFSMLEIYNEKVRDLLNKKKAPAGGLKIKMNKDQGFYGAIQLCFCWIQHFVPRHVCVDVQTH